MDGVAPRAGAWVETQSVLYVPQGHVVSHPVRVRGLKHTEHDFKQVRVLVAPRAGAWVETHDAVIEFELQNVAPRAGAWVETGDDDGELCNVLVAPRAGAWVETPCVIA